MKTFITLFFLLLFIHPVHAQKYTKQNTYRDALFLSELYQNYVEQGMIDPIDRQQFYTILQQYGIEPFPGHRHNPFLEKLFRKFHETQSAKSIGEITPSTFKKTELKNLSNALAPLDLQTMVLQGTADFMATRLKDEMAQYTMHLALGRIKNDAALSTLFPKTYQYITTIYEDGQYYHTDYRMIRYHAEEDLQTLPYQSLDYIKLKADPTYAALLDEISFYYQFIDRFRTEKTHPAEAINILTEQLKKSTSRKEQELVQMLNNAFKNVEGSGKIWITYADLQKNQLVMQFFKGLLFEQIRNHGGFSDLTGDLPESVTQLTLTYAPLFASLEEVTDRISRTEKPSLSETKTYLLSLYKLYQPVLEERMKKLGYHAPYNTAIKAIPLSFELQDAIAQKQYSAILPRMIDIASSISPDFYSRNRSAFQAMVFFTDIPHTQSPEEIKILLETNALPIGSAAIKRIQRWNVALNGYVGFSTGAEWLGGYPGSHFNYGLTAPIGITVSHRVHPVRPRSVSLFVSVLDIGALVNQNLAGNISTDTNLRFEQFLAPGIGLFYNAGKSPFSFGFHLTHHPSQRTIEIADTKIPHVSSWRANFSLLVDLPFFNLYSR